jgi:hypothetical protein
MSCIASRANATEHLVRIRCVEESSEGETRDKRTSRIAPLVVWAMRCPDGAIPNAPGGQTCVEEILISDEIPAQRIQVLVVPCEVTFYSNLDRAAPLYTNAFQGSNRSGIGSIFLNPKDKVHARLTKSEIAPIAVGYLAENGKNIPCKYVLLLNHNIAGVSDKDGNVLISVNAGGTWVFRAFVPEIGVLSQKDTIINDQPLARFTDHAFEVTLRDRETAVQLIHRRSVLPSKESQ